jgi:hypothetical protein
MPVWVEVMSQQLPTVPPVWPELARHWQLPDLVPYVQFLYRFQVVSSVGNTDSARVDVFAAMAQLRAIISDVQADELLFNLDRDLTGRVGLEDFQKFLQNWRVHIPRWQMAALFEAFVVALHREPTVEETVLGMALISRSPATSPCGQAWQALAKTLGEQISATGRSLVSFFKHFDKNRDGFMSPQELKQALLEGVPSLGSRFSDSQFETLMVHIDSQGLANGRISLVEFLRAVGPQQLEADLAHALLGEVLRPLYFRRPALEPIFQRLDPASKGAVSLVQFLDGLRELQRQLEAAGNDEENCFTDCQAWAIAEIASGNALCEGSEGHKVLVKYRNFLESLKIVDVQR